MLISLMISGAWASTGYPDEIASYLGVSCTPVCTVCHATNSGGSGTVTQPFGIAMEDRGLTGGSNNTSLTDALDQMTADVVDSDGDGTIDTDDLVGGVDPNTGTAFCDVVSPIYGCSTAPAGSAAAGLVGALLGLATTLTLRRR